MESSGRRGEKKTLRSKKKKTSRKGATSLTSFNKLWHKEIKILKPTEN